MKLCRLIVYYIFLVIQQLKFLNSHCSLYCSYPYFYYVLEHLKKKGKKWSNFQVLQEKRKFTELIALSTRIPKILLFSPASLNFGRGTSQKTYGKWAITGTSVCRSGVVKMARKHWPLPLLSKFFLCLDFPKCQTRF